LAAFGERYFNIPVKSSKKIFHLEIQGNRIKAGKRFLPAEKRILPVKKMVSSKNIRSKIEFSLPLSPYPGKLSLKMNPLDMKRLMIFYREEVA
jgi:hypothetical protein